MQKVLCEFAVEWDGQKLTAKPVYWPLWTELTGSLPEIPRPISVACFGPSDLTAFELGVFLALACRHFTDNWVAPAEDPQLSMEDSDF